MDNNDRDLTLRRQSVRTLTEAELSLAHGGRGSGHNNPPTSGPTDRTQTTNRTK